MNPTVPFTAPLLAVERDLFVLSHRNLTVHIIGHTGLSVVVAAFSVGVVTPQVLALWMGWMMFTSLSFAAGMLVFRRSAKLHTPGQITLSRWRWAHMLMLTFAGIGWGSLGVLLVRGAHDHNLLVLISFCGAMAHSAFSNATHDPPAFTVSTIIAMVIMMTQLPATFGSDTYAMMGMCVMYFISLVLAARNARITLVSSITLRLANEVLARDNANNATRAEKANRDKSEFLAAASHDLRQPVHALLLLVEAYRQQVPSAASNPLMQQITAAGHSISNLFNALMELSRLESGNEKLVLAPFELHEVIQRVLSRTQPEAQRKKLTLRLFEAKAQQATVVRTDKFLLERVLVNLLSNAVRYTEAGGVLLSVRPAHGAPGLWVEVWDTGVGINDLDRARIFDPYVQVGNGERDRSKGLGLGLAIVRNALKLLDITLTLHSQPGRGSCFRLHVPAALCVPSIRHVRPMLHAQPEPNQALLAPQFAGCRILLIDDDPMVLAAMQALLTGWSVDLRCASLGDASVLEVCQDGWVPACVLCDFRLPGTLNGIELLDLILDHHPQAVGILQTGELAQMVQTQAEEAGYLVLFKPVDPATLAATLNAVMGRRMGAVTP